MERFRESGSWPQSRFASSRSENAGGSSAKTYFLYDGDTPIVELNSAGITAVNTYGEFGLISRHTVSTNKSVFYSFDPEGSVNAIEGSGGTVSSTLLYDAYGDLIHSTGSGAKPPFGFGAQWGYYTDAESGLQLLTHRYFDAGTGRFINRDPIGQIGGVNAYTYVKNGPVAHQDRSGLYEDDDYKLGKPLLLPGVPIAPGGVDIRRNIARAQRYRKAVLSSMKSTAGGLLALLRPKAAIGCLSMLYTWYNSHVQKHGEWDYAQYGTRPPHHNSPYDKFGNFNAGATAAALGIPLGVAVTGADGAHGVENAGNWSNILPSPNDHGDDWIRAGYSWYLKTYGGN